MRQVWGYRADGAAEIFELADGQGLPDGWADTPAAFENQGEPETVVDPIIVEPVAPKRRGRPPKVKDAA